MAKVTYKSTLPAHVVTGWQPKVMGPLPNEQQLLTAHAFSQRFGLEAFAGLACALRPDGVTIAQQRIISALWANGTSTGAHQNKVRTLVARGDFERTGPGAITLTKQGQGTVDRYLNGKGAEAPKAAKGAAKPAADPVGKAKARNARKVARKPAQPAMTAAPADQGTANDGGGQAQPQG